MREKLQSFRRAISVKIRIFHVKERTKIREFKYHYESQITVV